MTNMATMTIFRKKTNFFLQNQSFAGHETWYVAFDAGTTKIVQIINLGDVLFLKARPNFLLNRKLART